MEESNRSKHEILWAPWRLGYVQHGAKDPASSPEVPNWLPGAEPSCFICRAVAESCDAKNLVVQRNSHTVVILNRFPYANGHLLVSPLRHQGDLSDLTSDEHLELMETVTSLTTHLRRVINAHGFNVGLNLGQVAGAGVPGHLHWHIVPRWPGDSNFMPTLAGVHLIPQSLEVLYELLVQAIAEG